MNRGLSVRLEGTPGAPGVATGPLWRWTDAPVEGDGGTIGLDDAAAAAADQLGTLAGRLRDLGREDEADILDAQALMASDTSLLDDAYRRIDDGAPPTDAIRAASERFAGQLEALDDAVLSARASDVRDVGARIARALEGRALALPAAPSIVLADDLPPSVAAEVPDGLLLGIALRAGSPTAHAVILARSLGIPAVCGIDGLAEVAIDPAAEAILDGAAGTLIIDPEAEDRAAAETRRAARVAQATRAAEHRGAPGRTADGRPVALLANVGNVADVGRAAAAGAEGIGLFRTEFLFLGRDRPPTEDEQLAAYRDALAAFVGRPVVIRLADIGGDKPIPYLDLPPESNPFLGVRAIRLAERQPDLLRCQLRAIWRAGAATGETPQVMAPMVATPRDLATFRRLIAEAAAELDATGAARADRLSVGIMIEVPAAVWWAPELAGGVDFLSIGTNDLTQYILAADRTNPALRPYQDGLDPAVLRAIAAIIAAARAAGVPVAVCGEMAADPASALILVGLGIDELSMDARALDDVRLALAGQVFAALESLASAALGAADGAAVRARAEARLG